MKPQQQPESEPIHWEAVEERLRRLEAVYAEIGTPGWFVREHVLRPLRDRWNRGERTPALATDIEEVEL